MQRRRRAPVPVLLAIGMLVGSAAARAQDCADVEFGSPISFAAGTSPRGLVAADFDEDGHLDVAVSAGDTITVLLGNGAGGFGPPSPFPVSGAGELAVADFNRDSHVDVAVTSTASVAVLYGTGTGALGGPTSYGSFFSPHDVAVADLNGDGRLDIVVAHEFGLAVFLAAPAGGFVSFVDLNLTGAPRALGLGDLDEDGRQDAVIVHQTGNSVSVRLGTGTGTFGPPATYATGTEPVSLVLDDLSGDGHLDFAVGLWSFLPDVSVRLGDGAGSFGAANGFGDTGGAIALDTADVNLDGRRDLVVAQFAGRVTVLSGNGSGAFGAAQDFAMGSSPSGLAVGDFDHDGRPDVVVPNNAFGANTVTRRLNAWNPGVRDGGFEAGNPWALWPFQGSTQFGTPLCNVAFCGTGGGSAAPYAGGNWAWFGGTPFVPEVAVVGQPLVLPGSPGLRLRFQLRMGFVSPPFTDQLIVAVDNTPVQTFLEPAVSEPGYTRREVDLSAFADGGCHDVTFNYGHFDGGTANMTVDDVELPPALAIDDVTLAEGDAGARTAVFRVSVSGSRSDAVTVQFATQDGTATAGVDYVGAAGALTFPVGVATQAIAVTINGDRDFETDETFAVVLSAPNGGALSDGLGTGGVTNDDLQPFVSVEPTAVVEGDSGTVPAVFAVRLATLSSRPITVDYATANGTATAPADYVATAATVTFPPGSSSRTVAVAVNGDISAEPDETFVVNLTSATGATVDQGQAEGLIVDDDGVSLSSLEVSHGFAQVYDLAARPGPSPRIEHFRLQQDPYASYEVVADAISGDVQPLVLERLSATGTAILQAGVPTGTGASVSLRWQNPLAVPVANQHIRVRSGGCSSDCGAEDTYRLRVYDTAYSVARFNNSGTQLTVVLIQNPGSQTINGWVRFWDTAGVLLDTAVVALPPHGSVVVNASARPALVGRSGSITISHDAGYGGLAGKAVALEPATGFSFDSPLAPRPR